jgi:adenine-specific DNA-methyltransferase
MLIQGDSLDALKSLLPYYAGQVKCIYIDPPYNTRSAFEHYDDNLEHSQWLAMIWPRLELLRELLAEDGSIWVSIDDNEGHYLKVVMDEVFGRRNYVANIIWQKKYARQNDALGLSQNHDHIHCFARRAEAFRPNKLARTQAQLGSYRNVDNDPRGEWQSVVYTCAKTRRERPNLYYPIKHPRTGEEVWPEESRVWGFDEERTAQNVAENRLWWGLRQELAKPRLKSFIAEVKSGIVPDTLWMRSDVGDNQDAKRETLALNDRDVFATPKPEALMARIIHIASDPGDLVLDSFLGSGTTAAVAHKMGRRWIGVEMGDHAVTHCAPRLHKVIEGEQGGISQVAGWQGGGGFTFYRLGEAVFDADGRIRVGIGFASLAAHVWFSETGVPVSAALPTNSPFLGTHDGYGYALLYNGVLGDKRPQGGNVLTYRTLDLIRASASGFVAPLTVYGEASRLSERRLREEGVTFKQTPYDVKAR